MPPLPPQSCRDKVSPLCLSVTSHRNPYLDLKLGRLVLMQRCTDPLFPPTLPGASLEPCTESAWLPFWYIAYHFAVDVCFLLDIFSAFLKITVSLNSRAPPFSVCSTAVDFCADIFLNQCIRMQLLVHHLTRKSYLLFCHKY